MFDEKNRVQKILWDCPFKKQDNLKDHGYFCESNLEIVGTYKKQVTLMKVFMIFEAGPTTKILNEDHHWDIKNVEVITQELDLQYI